MGVSIIFLLTPIRYFNHYNIIKYCDRPFETLEQMNNEQLANINDVVGRNDTYWHLGDFAWTNPNVFLDAINCNDIRIIVGNHDKSLLKSQLGSKVKLYYGYLDTKIESQKVTLCHYPMLSWNASFHGSWHLHGHVHGMISQPQKWSMDVGVDTVQYAPISWEHVKTYMERYR